MGTFVSQCNYTTNTSKTKLTLTDFRESLKKAMLLSGVKNQRSVFILTDYHLSACVTKDDIFLEDSNNILNQGEIANIWSREEREYIIRNIKQDAADLGIYEKLMETLFLTRIKDNLHMIISMSPVGT